MGLFKEVCEKIQTSKAPFMLVKHREEVPPAALVFPALAEVKYDGIFAAVVVSPSGRVKVFSRTGRPLWLQGRAYPVFYGAPAGLYIAELTCTGLSLEQLSGLVNPNRKKSWTGAEYAALVDGQCWVFHDYMTLENYLYAHLYTEGPDTLETRRRVLEGIHSYSALPSNSRLSVAQIVHSLAEYERFSEQVIRQGLEGTVLKQLRAKYCPGHKGWRAVKDVRGVHLDLKCLNIEMGKPGTKRDGQINKLQFCLPGCNKPFWADLGKGWTDEKRNELTYDRNTIIGRVFHVRALQISSTGKALRLPKVMEERIDKEVPDGEEGQPNE